MATPSPDPQKSWQRLAASARNAAAPVGLDMRVAVRAQISAMKPSAAETGLFDDVLALFGQRWLQAGFAVLAAGIRSLASLMIVLNPSIDG